MRLSKIHLRALISIALSLAVTTVFSFRSLAAPETGKVAVETVVPGLSLAQDSCGTLTGSATINGNAAQTGATVLSGSTIAAGSQSVTIDLGANGRIELKPNTTIILTCGPGTVNVKPQCATAKVTVTRGQAQIRKPSGDLVTKNAGEDEKFSGSGEINTTGGTDLVIDCSGQDTPVPVGATSGTTIGPGLIGILALIGVGAAIAVGIAVGDEKTGSAPVTPRAP